MVRIIKYKEHWDP